MKTNRILFAAMAATALLSSCDVEESVEAVSTTGPRTFTCTFAEPDTRVAVANNGKATWEAGDQILINAGSSGNKRATVTLTSDDISNDGKSATITIPDDLAPYDRKADRGILSTYYAMYPASAVAPGTLYYNQAFTTTNALLMAACNVEDTFVFYNLCGVISFTVSGDFDSYVFSGNHGERVAYDVYQARVRDDGDGPHVSYLQAADTYKVFTPLEQVEGTVKADGTTLNYVGLPNGSSFEGGFTFKFYKDGVLVKTATSTAPVNVDHGKLLPLGDITSRLETYVPPLESDHKSDIPTGSAIDLSADGAANCYIVTAPGIYKFPSQKGNSGEATANVFGAELLWETCCNNETVTKNSVIAAVDFEDNWIYFKTPDTILPGNALIAARDAQERIVWSWHIWIPATPITSDTYGLASAGLDLMDRNLGALVVAGDGNVQANGLFYQWGRKDPFIGVGAHGSSSIAKFAGTAKTVSSAPISIAQAIANPTQFASATGSPSDYDWTTEQSTTLWDKTKTLYDPCPPGWRVPDYRECSVFNGDVHTFDDYVYDAEQYCAKVGSAIFPLTGRLHYRSGSVDGKDARAYLWSAHSSEASSSKPDNIGLAVWMDIDTPSSSNPSNHWSERKGNGVSVRCILEKAPPFENEAGMPVQGSYTRIVFDSNVVELSGLCLSTGKDFLWGVGDEGYLYKFTNIDGAVTNIQAETIWTYSADMEGVTIDPSTGNLYLAIEPKRVYRVSAPYTSKTTLFDVEEAANMDNSGMEGIAWYKGDLYLGSQSGATLWRYTTSGTKQWKKQLGAIAPGIEEVGDLFYDSVTDLLWVSDSEAHKLFVFDGEVTKLKAIYDVSFIGNAESVCVDHDRNCVWVGDDGSTSKIYKISFTGL